MVFNLKCIWLKHMHRNVNNMYEFEVKEKKLKSNQIKLGLMNMKSG